MLIIFDFLSIATSFHIGLGVSTRIRFTVSVSVGVSIGIGSIGGAIQLLFSC